MQDVQLDAGISLLFTRSATTPAREPTALLLAFSMNVDASGNPTGPRNASQEAHRGDVLVVRGEERS